MGVTWKSPGPSRMGGGHMGGSHGSHLADLIGCRPALHRRARQQSLVELLRTRLVRRATRGARHTARVSARHTARVSGTTARVSAQHTARGAYERAFHGTYERVWWACGGRVVGVWWAC
eukprot:5500945-Prymnesium_polylepis.1